MKCPDFCALQLMFAVSLVLVTLLFTLRSVEAGEHNNKGGSADAPELPLDIDISNGNGPAVDSKADATPGCGCNKLSRDNLVSKSPDVADDGNIGTCHSDSSKEKKCEMPVENKLLEKDADIDNEVSVEIDEEDVPNVQKTSVDVDGDKVADTPKKTKDPLTPADIKMHLSILKTNPMVKISGGNFFMGTAKSFIAPDGESPMRETKVNTFYIDKKEVSNAEFAIFVATTDYETEVSGKI